MTTPPPAAPATPTTPVNITIPLGPSQQRDVAALCRFRDAHRISAAEMDKRLEIVARTIVGTHWERFGDVDQLITDGWIIELNDPANGVVMTPPPGSDASARISPVRLET